MEVVFWGAVREFTWGTIEKHGQPVRKLGQTKYLSGISFILP